MPARLDRGEDLAKELAKIASRLGSLETWIQQVQVSTPIEGSRMAEATLEASHLVRGLQQFQSNANFAASDWNVIEWAGFSITFADGTSASVNAGSKTLENDDPYYFYWREAFTSLQVTQTYADAIGDDRILLAIIQRPPEGDDPEEQTPFVHSFHALGETINSSKISPKAIIEPKLSDAAVSRRTIEDLAVNDDKIQDIVVSKLLSGTVTTLELEVVDESFLLSSGQQAIVIKDKQASPVPRVFIGRHGAGDEDYGITVRDPAGDIVFQTTGGGTFIEGAFINELTATKIAAGTISVAVLLTGTLYTSAGFPRVGIDSNGISGWNSGGDLQFQLRTSDGKATAGGGAVVLDEDGVHVNGQFLEFSDNVGVGGWLWAATERLFLVSGQTGSSDDRGIGIGVGAAPLVSPYDIRLDAPNGHIVVYTDTMRPIGLGQWLGNNTEYWEEVHADTFVEHTPVMPAHLSARDIVGAVRRTAEGKLDKRALPPDLLTTPSRKEAMAVILSRKARAIGEDLRRKGATAEEVGQFPIDAIPVTEQEIQAELGREDAVGVKVGLLNFATWETVRDLREQVDEIAARLSELDPIRKGKP